MFNQISFELVMHLSITNCNLNTHHIWEKNVSKKMKRRMWREGEELIVIYKENQVCLWFIKCLWHKRTTTTSLVIYKSPATQDNNNNTSLVIYKLFVPQDNNYNRHTYLVTLQHTLQHTHTPFPSHSWRSLKIEWVILTYELDNKTCITR